MKKFLFSLLFLIPLLSFSQNCTELQVTMFDSFGDGWNGNYLTIGDDSITLPFGEEGIDTICVNLDECNTITVGGGSWQEEVSWTIEGILDGGAPFDSTFGDCGSLSGCTDSLALNYDETAIYDDTSCTYPPCDGIVLLEATQQCLETPGGGQSLIVWSWIPMTDNPSCRLEQVYYGNNQVGPFIYPLGPGAQEAGNWGVFAGNGEMPPNWSEEHYFYAQLADGSFTDTAYFTPEPCILGCTDSTALNYNPWATDDNGECNNTTCGEGQTNISLEVTLDQYPGETGWTLVDVSNGQAIEQVLAGEYDFNQANATITYNVCIPETGVELILSDAFGDGLAGSQWGGTDGDFVILGDQEPCGDLDILWELETADFGDAAYSGVIYLPACELPIIEGCMNPGFVEFNPLAEENNPEDCITPKVPGCVDPDAFNYDENANIMQIFPMCNYTLTLEDDAEDGWGNSYLGVSQGDQVWTFTLGPGIASNSWNLPLATNKPVNVYYFEIGGAQQPQAEVEFQTLHNSFTLVNNNGIELMSGGTNPFADNGLGALQPFAAPWFDYYSEIPFCGDVCIPKVYGCMDLEAFNYNEEANTDDGSCIDIIYGCTNNLAFNYDENANIDNGSCQPVVVGCMDEIAWNYNFLANVEDGSCLYFGCTDEEALNFDETANVDNGACVYPILGCIDPNAFNFNVDANVDDGSCISVIIGCMDPTMWNYNENANTESDNCIPYIFGCTDITAFNWDPVANTDNESCVPFIYGCTDPNAFNFDPLANTEDFSCVNIILGCTDPNALNYNPEANTEDFSCIDILEGCMDPLAYNYDPIVNVDNGGCLYDAGCIGGPGNPYWLNDSCYAWVIVVDPNCCNLGWDEKCQSLYDYCSEEFSIGLDDLRDDEILIYPNPTTDIINITAKNDIKIDVINLLGEIIITIENQDQIDLSQYSNGLYILDITYNNIKIQHKIIKR